MKYKIILKTSHKFHGRVSNCLKTWLLGKDYVCLTDKLSGKFNEVSGSERDDYHSAEEKTVFMINEIIDGKYNDYDWLVFIDDDAILNTKMFEYIMGRLNKGHIYCLNMIGSYCHDHTLCFPSGGCGYFFSPQLAHNKNKMTSKNIGLEDVSMGYWIRENEIPLNGSIRLNGWFPFPQENINNDNILLDSGDYGEFIISQIKNHDERKKSLLCHMTHHYLRNIDLIKYVHGAFEEWTPDNLNLSLNRVDFL